MKARVYEDPTECQALSNPLTFLRVSIKTTWWGDMTIRSMLKHIPETGISLHPRGK